MNEPNTRCRLLVIDIFNSIHLVHVYVWSICVSNDISTVDKKRSNCVCWRNEFNSIVPLILTLDPIHIDTIANTIPILRTIHLVANFPLPLGRRRRRLLYVANRISRPRVNLVSSTFFIHFRFVFHSNRVIYFFFLLLKKEGS